MRRQRIKLPRQSTVLAAILILIAGHFAPAIADPTADLVRYKNDKFGFSISVPQSVFRRADERANDNGGVWISRNGRARLLAVAGRNETSDTLREYRRFVIENSYRGATFDYTPVRGNWFVLSGIQNGEVFYERVQFECNGRYIYGWQMRYPVADKQTFDRIVERVHRTFRTGRGTDGDCGS